MTPTGCCICGRSCKSIAPGAQLYCGERGQCEAKVFVLYGSDFEARWGRTHIKAPRATFIRARTRRGEKAALHNIRRARPDTILRINGRGWERVS